LSTYQTTGLAEFIGRSSSMAQIHVLGDATSGDDNGIVFAPENNQHCP